MKRALKQLKRNTKAVLGKAVRALSTANPELSPSLWGLAPKEHGLALGDVPLHPLLQKWGSPLHVVDAAKLDVNVDEFRSSSMDGSCEVFYSYKTNPIPGVLDRLHRRGIGAEVISAYELWLAFRLGVAPEKIVYNGPAKSDASLKEAIERDICLINANHPEELLRISALAESLGKRPRVGIRVNTPGVWSWQFGVPTDTGEALAAFELALGQKSLEVVALHAHRGQLIRTESELVQFVSQVLAFADELEERLGLNVEILDFGGSLAIPTVAGLGDVERGLSLRFMRPLHPPDVDATLSIRRYVELLESVVREHHVKRGRKTPRIFLEPGRALTGNTQLLLSSVTEIKRARQGIHFAILDAGINLAESVKNEYHQVFPVNRFGEERNTPYSLVGPICSPGDVLYTACWLPELKVGDSLAIMDAGAYFVPFATSFSFPRPAIVLLEHGQGTLLRGAETFEDLVVLDAPIRGPA